jgi:photosystem II stability/assembly factor-like uncharacterized protein
MFLGTAACFASAFVFAVACVQGQSMTWEPIVPLPNLSDQIPVLISFTDNRNGWLLTNNGELWQTSGDGSWKVLSQAPSGIKEIALLSRSVGWVRSSDGIYRTEDRGSHWSELQLPSNVTPSSVTGMSVVKGGSEVWLLYSDWERMPELARDSSYRFVKEDSVLQSAVIVSSNFGKDWRRQRLPKPAPQLLVRFHFVSDSPALLVGEGVIMYTEDIGGAWRVGTFNKDCVSPEFFQKDTQFDSGAVSVSYDGAAWVGYKSGSLLRSSDRGRTWCELQPARPSESGFVTIHFLNSRLGWATTTDRKLLGSIDGGASWAAAPMAERALTLQANGGRLWLLTDKQVMGLETSR